ncbi:hypothetical protein [Burkholderia gladioli]|uniref:hypothetical protein n=1 Tax=Burkholderia gladioli TaxID=28095 RepID=UPI003D2186FC
MTDTSTTPARAHLSDAERRERFERSQRLFDRAIELSAASIAFGFVGIFWWPSCFFGAATLTASFALGRMAEKASPYLEEK